MGSAGIFPFYCHFALLILYHWHCCLHCSCLTVLKRIYCAEKFKRELKWDEIQMWFSWTVQVLWCDYFWLYKMSRVKLFWCFHVQLWLPLTVACVWIFASEYVQPDVYLQMSVSLLCSCLYSQANVVLWMYDPDYFCMLIAVFLGRYGFMYFDIKRCGFKRGNDALCRVPAELFMHTLCNKGFAWAW